VSKSDGNIALLKRKKKNDAILTMIDDGLKGYDNFPFKFIKSSF